MRYLFPATDKEIRKAILRKNCFIHSSVMFKKDVAQVLGGYDESRETQHVEDYDLWLRLGGVGELANIPLFAVTLTLRDGSISGKNKITQLKKILGILRKHKNNYPGFAIAYFQAKVRIGLYRFFAFAEKKLPKKVSLNLIKIYKERW